MEWNFDKLGKTLSQAGKEVSEKVKETAGMVQLRQKAAAAEAEAEELFREIGRLFYEQHREEAGEDLADLIAGVDEAKSKAAAVKAQIARIRGTKICPECGAEIEYTALYCSHCGTLVPIPEEPEEEPEEAAEEAAPEEEACCEEAAEEACCEEAQEEACCEGAQEEACCEKPAEEACCEAQVEAEACEAADKAGDIAEEVKEKVDEAAEKAEAIAGDVKEEAEKAVEQVAETAEKVMDSAQEMAKEAWMKAGNFFSNVKDKFKSED